MEKYLFGFQTTDALFVAYKKFNWGLLIMNSQM